MVQDDQFPYGKLNDADEGTLDVAIGVEGNAVRIAFAKPVDWFAMPPAMALAMAEALVEHANALTAKLQ